MPIYVITDVMGEKYTTTDIEFAKIIKDAKINNEVLVCVIDGRTIVNIEPGHPLTDAPSKVIKCPDIGGNNILRVTCNDCPKRQGCPAHEQ